MCYKYYFNMGHQPHFKGSAATCGYCIGQHRITNQCKHDAFMCFPLGDQETSCRRKYWHWVSKGELDLDLWERVGSPGLISFLFYIEVGKLRPTEL